MTTRKYITEFGLHMFGFQCALVQQRYLDKLEKGVLRGVDLDSHQQLELDTTQSCHIYMVARRPRIMLDPASMKFSEEIVSGRFLIQRGASFEAHEFITRNELGSYPLRLECPYPHSELRIYDSKDNVILEANVAVLMAALNPRFWSILSLEILYIGQSYGVQGNRSAPERLQNHSTLQKIYADAIARTPDQEIWLVLWWFEPILITGAEGRPNQQFQVTEEEDDLHIEKVTGSLISEQHQINFTEAALIKYFEPEYNNLFKGTFPNFTHKTYSECYNIDLNFVSVELVTEDLGCRLGSPKVEPEWSHYITFPLHSPEERKSLFELF